MARREVSPAERARKRFARRQWARRWLTWRYIVGGLVVVLALGLAFYALYFSSWLRVTGVDVVGNSQLTDAEVLRTAKVESGGPLVRADIEAVQRRVASMATVKSVDVSRHWPHQVTITIVERAPIAVLQVGDSFAYLDAEGVSFGSVKKAPPGLPRVRRGGAADPDAIAEGARVVAVLDPAVAKLVDYVDVQTVDEISLRLRDGRVVRWGSAEQSEDKARVLLALLKQKARTYDVSVPGQPTSR